MAVVGLNYESMEGRTRVGANNGAVLRMGGRDNMMSLLEREGQAPVQESKNVLKYTSKTQAGLL